MNASRVHHVPERILVEHDQIGLVAGRHLAEVVAAHEPRPAGGRRRQDLAWREPRFAHELELTEERRAVRRADVAGIGARRHGHAGVVEPLQVAHRGGVRRHGGGLLNALADALGHEGVGQGAQVGERADHVLLPEAVLGEGQVQLLGERLAVALPHHEGRGVEHVVFFQELYEALVHRLVEHAVDQNVGPGLNGSAGRFELRGVHSHSLPGGVRLVDRRLHDGAVVGGRLPNDVPDLDEVHPGLDLLAHFLPGGLGRGDLEDGRITLVQPGSLDAGDERARRDDGRSPRSGVGSGAHVEVPHGPAHVHHARDPAAQVAAEGIGQSLLYPLQLLGVGPCRPQIEHVGPRVEAAALKEVHMSVHEARDHVLSVHLVHRRAVRHRHLARRPDRRNAIALDQDRRVRDDGRVGGVDGRRANQGGRVRRSGGLGHNGPHSDDAKESEEASESSHGQADSLGTGDGLQKRRHCR